MSEDSAKRSAAGVAGHYCFRCYGLNSVPDGRCVSCGGEIAAPTELSFDDRLVWTLRHPDADRALVAARTLGTRRFAAAVPQLTAVVLDPPDPFLAAEALRSLIAIQGAATLRPMLEELARGDSFMPAQVARDALDRLGPQ